MAFAFRELKLVVEPGGAVGLAALLSGQLDARGKTVVVVLSGGNVDAGSVRQNDRLTQGDRAGRFAPVRDHYQTSWQDGPSPYHASAEQDQKNNALKRRTRSFRPATSAGLMPARRSRVLRDGRSRH